VQISVYYILSCTVVLVLGCNWPFLAVVKHVNKLAIAISALMMEAARTSETLVNFYQTTRRYNPEDSQLQVFSGSEHTSRKALYKCKPTRGLVGWQYRRNKSTKWREKMTVYVWGDPLFKHWTGNDLVFR
jgi:hypothetical protein